MERGWRDITPNCPRCGSSNTKFCYYNNYSLTQPRYFCKGCRRYWTKGGSLRNVPVGGGCRKSRRSRSSSLRLVSAGPLNHHSHHGVTNPSSIHTMPIFGNVGRNTNNIQILPHSSSYSSSGDLSNMVESSTQPMNFEAPTIDLAAVYANFLNQKVAANSSEQSLRSSVPFCDHVDNNTNGSNMQSNVDLFSSIPDATTIVHSNQVMDPLLIPFSTSQTLSMPQMSNDHDHSRFFDRVDFNTVRDAPIMQHEVELELPPLPGESSSTHNVHQEMHWITSNNNNNNNRDVDNLQASQDAQFSNLLIGSWMSPSLDLPGFETSSSPSKPT